MCLIFNNMTTPNIAEKNHEKATPAKMDIFGNVLIPALVEKILFYLAPEDLNSAVSCCSRWKFIIRNLNDSFWKKLCSREGYLEVETSQRTQFCTNFLQRYKYWQVNLAQCLI